MGKNDFVGNVVIGEEGVEQEDEEGEDNGEIDDESMPVFNFVILCLSKRPLVDESGGKTEFN